MNTMTFEQVAAVLNEIQQQATGQKALTPTNTAEFVSCADSTLRTGYDPVLQAISQVLSRTIFSVRPYSRKFAGLEVSETAWGNHVRKLQIADIPIDDKDDRYAWPVAWGTTETPVSGDGESVDMYTIKKEKILQTNFYGSAVYQDHITIWRDQLENAFRGPEEFGRFITMKMQNMSDKHEQYRENIARSVLANLMGAVIAENQADRVVHLLSEYNTATGKALTATTVYDPANYKSFMQWVFARIAALCAMMTERSNKYQTIVNGMQVMHHTPYDRQKVYLYAPIRYQSEAMALADTYHDNYLRLADNDTVNYWQSIETPDTINVTPCYINASGQPTTPADAVSQSAIMGVIFDEEAAGYATTQNWSAPTPLNARGGYSNIWFHTTFKAWTDNTEKVVVLLLD